MALPSLARADDDSWTSHGPIGGEVNALVYAANAPEVIYAVAGGGLNKSVDGSQSWSSINDGLGEHRVHTVYVIREFHGALYRSDDGAETWSPVAAAPSGLNVCALDPSTSERLYAIAGATFYERGRMSMARCSAADANGDGQLAVADLVTAVDHALAGCD